jgi:iron complex outermembrane receptor protein
MHQRTQIAVAVAMAITSMGTAIAQTADTAPVQSVEVTGSRIKRAAAEGALPVTVVTRQQLEDSGAVTIAEFIRSSTFSSAGQFRPQSGSSAQSYAGANLRGLGSNRTLVLVDGRRVAKAPNVGDAADMNSIPMAAVERIEILTDGASAVYGSEAIGGVINIILRKDFDGVYYSVGRTKTNITGGDREEASAMIGMTGEKGRIIAGFSKTKRDIIFVRDYPWGAVQGASPSSNNFFEAVDDGEGGLAQGAKFLGLAGSCNFPEKGFYVRSNGRCAYDFNLVAADEAATGATSMYARGEYKIGADFNAYVTLSSTNNTSFGRFAAVPDSILVAAGSPNNTSATPNAPVYLAHRFAAAGNRDTSTDGNLTDVALGVQGTVSGFDIDVGTRKTKSHLIETGRGFVVRTLATAAINNGTYNVGNPFANSDAVLKSITTTTGRDSLFESTEFYASATHDVFNMAGGASRIYAALEHRKEQYADLYDSLSEAGEVLGSSGNSAGGSRKVDSASMEWLFPFSKTLEGTLAARYEKYSDYGSDFSPKASVRWAPTRALTLRASVGRGFRAPSLPDVTAKPSFSADSVIDLKNCTAQGFTEAECKGQSFQINGLRISNPSLGSEKSKQWSMGGAYDVNQSFTIKADYWNTEITDVISFISAQTIVNRDNGTEDRPIPNGLSITRDPVTGQILKIVAGSTNEGLLKYSGLDVGATFAHKYASVGKFKHDLTWSHVYKSETNGTDFNGTFGSPKNRVALNNTWGLGMFDLAWNVNAIGKNGDKEDDSYVSTYTTHDLQATVSPGFIKGMKLSIGLVNAFNKQPQLVSNTSKPFNYDLYDAYGRQAYFRLEQKF